MLAGPMDYTPGCFSNATREQFKPGTGLCQGTRAHQLAMYAVFFSPLQMVAGTPKELEGAPGMEFIEKVPAVWEETRVVNGEPAKYVTIARKNGRNWYLGSMTNWDARDLVVPLGFLGQGDYDTKIFADGPSADREAASLAISTRRVTSGGTLNLHIAPGGGAAIIFTPAR
jgi:alpha-glucosidase